MNRVPYCYLPISNKYVTWQEAQQYCKELKSNLVSITSKKEQNFIASITTNSIWIGLRKKQDWEWPDG